ncbi:MAG: tellurite resistance TerB family protein [Tabrizicola sp.]|nr:tellurite resistance TerB family protein [Tabrizicola sp.]
MLNAKSLLDSLLGGVSQATGGQSAKGLADKAKGAWDNQSAVGKGAIAGGLLGVLLTSGIGGMAYKAYEDWKKGQGATALPAPEEEFLPADADRADEMATHLLQAMIAAAKADGHVTAEERAKIDAQLGNLGLEDEAAALIAAELDAPLDVGRIAALAKTEAEAAQIYAASLLSVDPEGPAEKGYLAMLAARLQLDEGLVLRLHEQAARL